MTVSEFIEQLKKLPPDSIVLIGNYLDEVFGWNELDVDDQHLKIMETRVEKSDGSQYYEGEYYEIETQDTGQEAVIIR